MRLRGGMNRWMRVSGAEQQLACLPKKVIRLAGLDDDGERTGEGACALANPSDPRNRSGQDHDATIGLLSEQLLDQLQAVAARHIDVA